MSKKTFFNLFSRLLTSSKMFYTNLCIVSKLNIKMLYIMISTTSFYYINWVAKDVLHNVLDKFKNLPFI